VPDTATGCREFEADLSALLDDELTPERAAEVRAHAAACASCGRLLARLARVDFALARAPAPAVPASLRARLEARLATPRLADTDSRRIARAPRRAWRGRAAGALAAAAAGVALYLAVASREAVRPETAASPPQIARPPAEIPRQALQQLANRPAPARPAPAPSPAPAPAAAPLDLESVSEEDLGLALELDTVEDLDVIGNLELLELLLASESS
jgi:hypothetical protein